jgi:DNA-binding LacI/PurR family transcriptional regulator
MSNQRDIAQVLGINQATVSLALRGDLSISAPMRERVRETAERLGYRQNAYVAMLMSRIRSGRKLSEQGVIALIVDARSEQEWYRIRSYRVYHQGLIRRAAELGFHIESFFLRAPGVNARTLDRILRARGIRGIILAPPNRGNRALALDWDRYSCVGCGHAREPRLFDRVANDHAQNVIIAFKELSAMGYRRIGLSLPGETSRVPELKWMSGYLESQNRLPKKQRIPLFTGDSPHPTLAEFRAWYRQWRPDVLLCLTGHERQWLDAMRLQIPRDIGLAYLVRQPGATVAGIDEKNEVIGASAVEWVASHIVRNEYGVPVHPKLILIEGVWMHGATVASSS